MADGSKPFVMRATAGSGRMSAAMARAQRAIRVLVIQPPTRQGVRSLLPHVEEGEEGIGYKPPLGVLYVASMVQAHSDHEVQVIDALAEKLNFAQVVALAVAFQPEVVGLSAWTDFWYPTYHLGELLKAALPGIHLTLGGPHLGIYPHETLAVPFVDSVIVGDGEEPFLALCNLVANGVTDNSLPGLHFKADGVKATPDTFFTQGELDDLPHPNRTLLPLENYTSVLGKSSHITTMITSRGCPFRCTFCKLSFQKTLMRSAESVLEEFRQIHQLGIREVEIYDDTFTWSRPRLEAICAGLIQADLGITWAIRDRVSASSVDPKFMALLYRAGCRRIHYGVESGVQRVIDGMNKKITLEQASRAVRLAKEARMTVLVYFMFGNLDETQADMRASIDFALKLNADVTQFSITIPYAGTEMYGRALASGLIQHDFWGAFARQPVPDFEIPQIIEQHVDKATLMALRNEAIRRFYFRPGYILHELSRLGSWRELLRKGRMAIRLGRSLFKT